MTFQAQITRIGNVGTHKMCRIWLEIPQERAMSFIARFGWATEEKPIPVTISPEEAEARREPTSHENVLDKRLENSPAGVHNPYSRRAGILAADKMFQKWIEAPDSDPATFAASYIRNQCKVTSRKDILPGSDAALRFDLLQSKFVVWREGPKHGIA